jgi:hypothetical protein
MPNTKKIPIGGLNTDDAEYLLDPKEYLGGLNIRFATTENGQVGKISNVEGTIEKTQTLNEFGVRSTFNLPAGTNETIGAYEDTSNRRIIWFNWNSSGSHGVYCYDFDTDLIYTVLKNADVTGGLNFQRSKFMHSIAHIDNIIFWTDDFNEPRRINVERGIKTNHPTYVSNEGTYTIPLAQSAITIIRPQPVYPANVGFYTTVNGADDLNFDTYQSTYRFVYKDKEYSTFCTYSTILPTAGALGYFKFIIPLEQKIPSDIEKIEMAVRFGISGKLSIVRTWYADKDAAAIAAHNAGTTALEFDYYNNTLGVNVDDATASKPFDSVPRLAGTLDITKNRLFMGDILLGYDAPNTTSITLSLSNTAGSNGMPVFKSGSSYKYGVVFYDDFGRFCGVVPGPSISVPDRTEINSQFAIGINWTLSNANAINEIPDWAKYFSVVRTKNKRTGFFQQFKSSELRVASKNDAGEYVLGLDTTNVKVFGLAIKASDLSLFGQGYSYQQGDLVNIYNGLVKYTSRVLDTYSDFIIVEYVLISNPLTSNDEVIVEVYSPKKTSENEIFYEIANKTPILNPGTSTRTYGDLFSTTGGDVTLKTRTRPDTTTYIVETMNYNDGIYTVWADNTGRAAIEINDKVERLNTAVCYSNVFNTANNGLVSFDALSVSILPLDLGAIEKLISTSKVQFEGTVMLAIGQQETASLYIGETQIFDASGSSFIAKSSGVIGQVNILRGSYGTINPESVYEWSGEVLFFDTTKGSWVRYNNQGLSEISLIKMSKYFKKIGSDILNYYKSPETYNFANNNSPIRVLGGVDPFHTEYLMNMPRMTVIPQNEVLTDMELGSNTYAYTLALATLVAVPETLTGFTYELGFGPSASQTFVLTGTNLRTGMIATVTGTTDYEVSLNNTAFSQSVSIAEVGSAISSTVYVRLKAGRVVGNYNSQTINCQTQNAELSDTVVCSGSVTANVTPRIIATPSSLTGLDYVEGFGPSIAQQFTIQALNLTAGGGTIAIAATQNFEVSVTNALQGFSSSVVTLPYTGTGTLANNTIWVRLKSGRLVGSFGPENVGVAGGGASTNVAVSGSVTVQPPASYYGYGAPANYYTTSATACSNYNTARYVYAAEGHPSGVTRLYNDTGLQYPITGQNNKWLSISLNGTGAVYSVQLDNDGYVIATTSC